MPVSEKAFLKKEFLKSIAKSYNSLQYAPQLIDWLVYIYPKRNLMHLNKYQLHKALNDALLKDYDGEYQYKYSLFKKFQKQKLVAGFEMKVNRSRVDFLTINGYTTSFEIKSTIDDLRKLEKQASDYLSAFEFNNVIVDEKHIDSCYSILPKSFGIIILRDNKQRIIRPSIANKKIIPGSQLELLSKLELSTHFTSTNQIEILKRYKAKQINEIFKLSLKKRYERRWKFIVENSDVILPIDLQFFFNTNISPSIIYS